MRSLPMSEVLFKAEYLGTISSIQPPQLISEDSGSHICWRYDDRTTIVKAATSVTCIGQKFKRRVRRCLPAKFRS